MIQINDIKPIVEIPDFSIYIYYSIFLLAFILLIMLFFFLYKYFKKNPKTKEYEYYKKLQNLDFNNAKETAYSISKYGRLLASDERQKRLVEELSDALEAYKYKKEIPSEITVDIQAKFRIFMESLDVR
jgi:hypothetical protein